MPNEYKELDSMLTNGALTVPATDDIDMLALREYCRDNGRQYSDLSEAEITRFRRNPLRTHFLAT